MFAPSKARQALRLAIIPTRCLSRSNNNVHQCPCGCSRFQPGLSSSLFPRQLSSITFQNSRAVILEQNTRCTGPKRGYASGLSNQWATEAEEAHAKLIEAAEARVNVYKKVLEDEAEATDIDIKGQIERAKVQKELAPLVEVWNKYLELKQSIIDMKPFLEDSDPTLREMFEAEHASLGTELDTLVTSTLPTVLLPPPSTAALPAVMSFNAGVGGLESALCTEDLARMYLRFATNRGWKVEEISRVEGTGGKGGGGIRELTVKFEPPQYAGEGMEVYGALQWEKGVHRIQRVPANETQGRIHTSTVAVIVLPMYPDTAEAPLVDPKDVRIDVMRARGAGGQHVNRTESAVRLTHIPTGITVSMQDSRSQHQNRAWAWEILRARLSEKKHNEEVEARRASRRDQVKGADRSDKIRTYNFNQDRLTDHRFGITVTGLQHVLDGEGLEDVISMMKKDFNERRLEALLKGEEDLDY
ncbi:peptide chain release factor 1 [Cryptococcus neoformans]|nr:peptide chain release factor 1 [Cryptococcus neoformans var. grubii]